MTEKATARTTGPISIGNRNTGSLQNCLPTLCQASGMSLRDIEHCTRMIALATRTMERSSPVDVSFLAILPILKLKKPELYREFIQGKCATIKVTNYLDELANAATNTEDIQRELTRAEIALILGNHRRDPETTAQLRALAEGKEPARPELLPSNVKTVHRSVLSRYFPNDPFSQTAAIPLYNHDGGIHRPLPDAHAPMTGIDREP